MASYENETKEYFSDRTGKIILGVLILILLALWGLYAYSIFFEKNNHDLNCFDVSYQNPILYSNFTCIDSSGYLHLQVSGQKEEFDLNLKILLQNGSKTLRTINSSSLSMNQARVFILDGNFSKYQNIDIYPVIKVGRTLRECEIIIQEIKSNIIGRCNE